jgi:hypothetical protein
LCQFVVILDCAVARGFWWENEWGWAAVEGERIAMVEGRVPKMASTENEGVREGGLDQRVTSWRTDERERLATARLLP